MLRDVNFGMKQDFQKLMLILFDNEVEGGVLAFWTPESYQRRYLCLCCNTSLQKILVTSISSSYDVTVVAPDTTFYEQFALRMLEVFVHLG